MKAYLGDSVYVEWGSDGFAPGEIVLTTENGYNDDPRNRIVLEQEVQRSLLLVIEQINNQKED